jgi:hypothetical protein
MRVALSLTRPATFKRRRQMAANFACRGEFQLKIAARGWQTAIGNWIDRTKVPQPRSLILLLSKVDPTCR